MYVFSSMATRLVLTTCSIHQLIVYVPYGVVLEKATLTTNRRHGRFKRHFRHILCALSTDPSVTHATPLCSLIATWPSDVNYVYWFNETTLEYELGDQTYYESCYYGSYTLMSNPYYTPPATIAAASATFAFTKAGNAVLPGYSARLLVCLQYPNQSSLYWSIGL